MSTVSALEKVGRRRVDIHGLIVELDMDQGMYWNIEVPVQRNVEYTDAPP